MLAVFNVNVAYDADTFVDGDGIMTLREAVFEANDNPAHDTILFDLPANQDKTHPRPRRTLHHRIGHDRHRRPGHHHRRE